MAGSPGGPTDNRAALLEKCWNQLESGVLAQTPRIFEEAHLALARSHSPESAQVARELGMKLAALAGVYRGAVRNAHERAAGVFLGQRKAAGTASGGLSLSLVGMDTNDLAGQVEQATARLRELVQAQWLDVARRLHTLAGRNLAESDLALHPGIFLQAAADGIGLTGAAAAAMVRNLPPALAPALGAAYEAIDALLAAAGVEAQSVARAAPVLRANVSAPPRPAAAPAARDAASRREEALLGLDTQGSFAPPAALRRAAPPAPRADAVPESEIPELQPDAWGLREYVRLQALSGINSSVLYDSAMQHLAHSKGAAPIEVDPPAPTLAQAIAAALRLDATMAARVDRRAARPPAAGGAPSEAASAAKEDSSDELPDTREYSRRLIAMAGTPLHKHTIQLASRIFTRMERDKLVGEPVRGLLVSLRFPFLELALGDPSVFVRPSHPARQLVNAVGSAAIGLAADSPAGKRFVQQLRAAVQYVLSSTGAFEGAFAQAHEQFGGFVAEQARAAAAGPLAVALHALAGAEERESRAIELGSVFGDMLAAAPLDPVLRHFLMHDWARALIEISDATAAGQQVPAGLQSRMLSLVPDLVWSVLPVSTAQDRNRFADVVPTILETLRDGVARIGWSANRLKDMVDHLREVHAKALAGGEAGAAGTPFFVSTVRIRLDGFRLETLAAPLRSRPFEIVEEATHGFLEAQGCGVQHRRVQEKPGSSPAMSADDAEEAIERWRPGMWFDLRMGRNSLRVRLEGCTASRTLALFATAPEPGLMSLSHASLVAGVRNAWIVPVEMVPIFGRSFRTVLADLQRSMQAGEGGHVAS